MLENADKFMLSKNENHLSKLNKDDQASLHKFTSLFKNIRGNELIKKTYIDYPYFAVKSEIAEKILNEKELTAVKNVKNLSHEKTLFTLGL